MKNNYGVGFATFFNERALEAFRKKQRPPVISMDAPSYRSFKKSLPPDGKVLVTDFGFMFCGCIFEVRA